MTSYLNFLYSFISRRTRVDNFADIIKIATMPIKAKIKATFEDSKKVE